MKDKLGTEHIAWTCLSCGFINCWNWESDSFTGDVGILMACDNCNRKTMMELKDE
jgi:hypothetical protein